MKKIILLLCVGFFFSLSGYAQISYGGTKLTNATGSPLNIGNSPNTPLSYLGLRISGLGGLYWSEFSATKFFQLDLTPANPRIAGTGNQIVFYNTEKSIFNSIQVANVYNYSDARAKTNISPLLHATETVLSLNPVKYNFKDSGMELRKSSTGESLQEIGFLAQEVEQVLPEVVYEDAEGRKLINYTALIPVLAESIKELTGEIDKLKEEIEDLRAEKTTTGIQNAENQNKVALYQNSPNPFSGITVIGYNIPEMTQSASICVFNLQGVMILKKAISNIGTGEITIEAGALQSGMYLYALIVDNKTIDTKRMIVAN